MTYIEISWLPEEKNEVTMGALISGVFMKSALLMLAIGLAMLSFPGYAEDVRDEKVQFAPGSNGVTIKDTISGHQSINYRLSARAGQSMTIALNSNNTANYFNIFAPGKAPGGEAMYIGSVNGNQYSGTLPLDGVYTVQVYMMRSAARRNEKANYTLDIRIDGTAEDPTSQPPGGFDSKLELQGISFHITSPNQGSINQLVIVPAGLSIDNSVIQREIDGTVTNAEIADLNVDGSPEIYVYINSAGSGSYGQLIAYAVNNKKSLSEIYLPPIENDPKNSRGYMGHDEFAVVENILGRRFPVYREGDTNAMPTGLTRQLQYKLTQGEASWVLVLDKSIEY